MKTVRWQKLWILPPLIIGIAVFMMMKQGRKPPEQITATEIARPARIIEVPSVNLIPEAEGFGIVQPALKWTAVAEVSGRIIDIHPRLKNGEIIARNSLLFSIDPVDYELNIATAEAQIAELNVQEQNTRASLDIEQRKLKIAERELQRLEKLADKGTTSQSNLDTARQNLLSSRAAVQNTTNLLTLLPSKIKVQEAKLAQARRDLANTQIRAPFDMRIAGLNIEKDQYVSKGQSLFEGGSIDQVEIISQFPLTALKNLVLNQKNTFSSAAELGEHISQMTGFNARIELDMGDHVAQWDARFARFSDSIDTSTRTIGIVLTVDKPYEKIIPGYRPPLSKGMFVKALLHGQPQSERLIVPRNAIRNDRVYRLDDENRMTTIPIKRLFNQQDISIVAAGLNAGDKIVVSDLIPAIDGMLLNPQLDATLQQQLMTHHQPGTAQ